MNANPLHLPQTATMIAASLLFGTAHAQAPAAPMVTKPLATGVYLIQGGASGDGNSAFILGHDGVIAIDTKGTPESGREMLAQIAAITPKPVTHVILTHSDEDHVDGLGGFPKGLTIIAQRNCRTEMQTEATGREAFLVDYLPTQLVDKHESLRIDGVRLELFHTAPAHTSGDLVIYLPDQKIVFTGDLVSPRFPFPIIHLAKHGTSAGWIETMQAVVKLDSDLFVVGHGDPQPKSVLVKRLADTEARRAAIQKAVTDGQSLAEMQKSFGEDHPPPRPPGTPAFPTFTETVYQELTRP